MLKAGITGGIGSGKSVVCQVFSTLGIPVFNADEAARFLMENDKSLIRSIKNLMGEEVYLNGLLNRSKVSSIIYSHPEKLAGLNALVHPATIAFAEQWLSKQTTPYVIKEAALFFESGSHKEMDILIGVYAPVSLRIERTMKRSNLTRAQVQAIIDKQMDENEKMSRCNYVIKNDDLLAITPQVLNIHKLLIEQSYAR